MRLDIFYLIIIYLIALPSVRLFPDLSYGSLKAPTVAVYNLTLAGFPKVAIFTSAHCQGAQLR
jgi:hypothetical protein